MNNVDPTFTQDVEAVFDYLELSSKDDLPPTEQNPKEEINYLAQDRKAAFDKLFPKPTVSYSDSVIVPSSNLSLEKPALTLESVRTSYLGETSLANFIGTEVPSSPDLGNEKTINSARPAVLRLKSRISNAPGSIPATNQTSASKLRESTEVIPEVKEDSKVSELTSREAAISRVQKFLNTNQLSSNQGEVETSQPKYSSSIHHLHSLRNRPQSSEKTMLLSQRTGLTTEGKLRSITRDSAFQFSRTQTSLNNPLSKLHSKIAPQFKNLDLSSQEVLGKKATSLLEPIEAPQGKASQHKFEVAGEDGGQDPQVGLPSTEWLKSRNSTSEAIFERPSEEQISPSQLSPQIEIKDWKVPPFSKDLQLPIYEPLSSRDHQKETKDKIYSSNKSKEMKEVGRPLSKDRLIKAKDFSKYRPPKGEGLATSFKYSFERRFGDKSDGLNSGKFSNFSKPNSFQTKRFQAGSTSGPSSNIALKRSEKIEMPSKYRSKDLFSGGGLSNNLGVNIGSNYATSSLNHPIANPSGISSHIPALSLQPSLGLNLGTKRASASGPFMSGFGAVSSQGIGQSKYHRDKRDRDRRDRLY